MVSTIQNSSAADVVRRLAPECSTEVFVNLEREKIQTAAQLAYLDKNDLKDLGLGMLDRCKIFKSLQEVFATGAQQAVVATSAGVDFQTSPTPRGAAVVPMPSSRLQGAQLSPRRLLSAPGPKPADGNAPAKPRIIGEDSSTAPNMHFLAADAGQADTDFLDDVQQRMDFWLKAAQSSAMHMDIHRANTQSVDAREDFLEDLFDISPERVAKVFKTIDADGDGHISADELKEGLKRCGVHSITNEALNDILSAVSRKQNALRLPQFGAILTRLKLAQLLSRQHGDDEPIDFRYTDYFNLEFETKDIPASELRSFFFGHRRKPASPDDPKWVRWVHLSGLIGGPRKVDLAVLLALTLKYQLHPLGVEDVIEQCQTIFNRCGDHYFFAVEQLVCTSGQDGQTPVKVRGDHTSIFCSGAPHFDTVISITQPDKFFEKDWPGGDKLEIEPQPRWLRKLDGWLKKPRSRVRENRAVFLTYQIVDLAVDDILEVVAAYKERLKFMEEALQQDGAEVGSKWVREISSIHLQVDVVVRRLRGLHRLMRKWREEDILKDGLAGNLQDVIDHLDDAVDDSNHFISKCESLTRSYQRLVDKAQDEEGRERDDTMNLWLFVLAIGSFIFEPCSFFSGVYGMNFVQPDGTPAIPELLSPNGYEYFWVGVISYLCISSSIAVLAWKRTYGKKKVPSIEDQPNEARKVSLNSTVSNEGYQRMP